MPGPEGLGSALQLFCHRGYRPPSEEGEAKPPFPASPVIQNFKGPDVVSFLRVLAKRIPGKIFILMDRAGIHRSKIVKAFLRRNPRISVFHFPAYAPETNPVEGCWGHAKYHQMACLVAEDVDDLGFAAESALNEISSSRHLISSFISHALGKGFAPS
jgi:hypothetical protein